MAKIPRYEEQQRLDSFGPSQMYSGREARMTGEALAGFGKDLQQFAGKFNAYKNAKDTADESIFAKKWKDSADVVAQNTKQQIETGKIPGLAEDGSNVLDLYDSSFQKLKDEAMQITDNRRRQIALNSIGMGQTAYRKDMQGFSESTYNSYMFKSAEDSLNITSAKVFNDPQLAVAQMKEYEAYIDKLPVGIDNKMKMKELARKSIPLSAISKYQEEGNFKKAKELLTGELSQYFTAEERIKLLEKNESEYKADRTFRWSEEEKERKLKKERMLDLKVDSMSRAYDMIVSDDPEARVAGRTEAKNLLKSGVIKIEEFNSMMRTGDALKYEGTDQEFLRLTDRLVRGENIENFTEDVMKNDNLHPKQARQLINQYNSLRKTRNTDPEKRQQVSGGMRFIRDAFPVSSLDRLTEDSAKKNAMAAKATQAYLRALEAGSKDPYAAAVRAVKQVDPHNKMVSVFSGDTAGAQTKRTVRDIKQDIYSIKENYNLIKNRNPKEAQDYAKKMRNRLEELQKEQKVKEQEAEIIRALKEEVK